MANLVQMKRKDVRVVYFVLSIIAIIIKIPFYIFLFLGGVAEKVIEFIDCAGFVPAEFYIKVRRY